MMDFGPTAAVNGISVFDWADPEVRETIRELAHLPEDFELKYDQMYIASVASGIIVGEAAHLRYRMEQLRRNEQCRQAAKTQIHVTAHRILGEPLGEV